MLLLQLLLTALLSVAVHAEPPTEEEQRLFSKIGIPGPPQHRPDSREEEVPSYMMELYRQHDRVLGKGLATAVSSFPATQSSSDNQISERRWQFEFNISDLPKLEHITQAHMRIYKVKGSKQKETPYKVNVFHILRQADLELINSNEYYLLSPYNSSLAVRLLDTQELESRQSHWVSFDVAKAVRVQQELEKRTIVFEIMYTPINPIDVSPSSRGIRFTKSRGKQPSLVIFTDDGSHDVRIGDDERNVRTAGTIEESHYDPTQSYCQRKELFIDFSRLGWDWIIGPRGFDAFMCSGVCNLTFSAKLKISNHAYLQSYMESRYKNIPKPCCSPTKLSPMTLIYYVDNGIKMREYSQMRVEQCGCE